MNHQLAASVVAKECSCSVDPVSLRVGTRDGPAGTWAGNLPATVWVGCNVSFVARTHLILPFPNGTAPFSVEYDTSS